MAALCVKSRLRCGLQTPSGPGIEKWAGSTNAQNANYLAILITFIANALTLSLTEFDRVCQ
jgi:hypothetical protein